MSTSAAAGNRFSALNFQSSQLVTLDWTQLSKTFGLSKNLAENDWWQEQQLQLAWKTLKTTSSSGKDSDSLEKWQIVPLYQRFPHVPSFGGSVTTTVRLGFSVASWPPEPTAHKIGKRHHGDVCPRDNRHGSLRHRKGALSLALVAAWKNPNRWSAISRGVIGRSGKSMLAWRVLDRRMIQRAHLHDTPLQPTIPPFLVRTQNFRHDFLPT